MLKEKYNHDEKIKRVISIEINKNQIVSKQNSQQNEDKNNKDN